MPSKINLINKNFGRLKIIDVSPSKRNLRGDSIVFWKCECICGNIIETRSQNLLNDSTKSCGCLQIETARNQGKNNFKGPGIAGINSLFKKYQRSAKRRQLKFELSKEEFKSYLFQNCYYCGSGFKSIWRRKEVNQKLEYNGLDRIDSNQGYIKNNIVSCCKFCNKAKSDLPKIEFLNLIKNIYERHINEK